MTEQQAVVRCQLSGTVAADAALPPARITPPKTARQTGVRLITGVIEQTPVVLQRLSDKSDWSDVSDLPAGSRRALSLYRQVPPQSPPRVKQAFA